MKQVFTLLTSILVSCSVIAQSPEMINYQAVVRNSSNNLVSNTQLKMQISILQGTIDGNAIYVETQTPTTNTNGLVSIAIGDGSVVNGAMASIDWAKGPYYIKTETDPFGGDNYTISGTSQLLSVPYALHAKTADSINIKSSHYVGELYGGGVVFWVDQTGKHGLIVSMVDLSANQIWSNVTSTLIGISAQSDWDGQSNSNAIINQNGHTSSAAQLCYNYVNADYGTGIYDDWYLPAIGELYDLFYNFKSVQKSLDCDHNSSTTIISRKMYWSSTEDPRGYGNVIILDVRNGDTGYASKDYNGEDYCPYIRAIRAF